MLTGRDIPNMHTVNKDKHASLFIARNLTDCEGPCYYESSIVSSALGGLLQTYKQFRVARIHADGFARRQNRSFV